MADDLLTISDMVADALDLSGNELNEVRAAAPVISMLPAVPSSNGLFHKYSVMTQLPNVDFREEYVGRDLDHSIDEIRSFELKHLDFSWKIDVATAQAWKKGKEDIIAREGRRHVMSTLFTLETQFINGTLGGKAGGFEGLANNSNLATLAGSDLVINAGGTGGSSVYLMRVSDAENCMVYKGEGMAVSLGETRIQDTLDGSGKHFPSYYTPAGSWFGAQYGALYSTARICNIDASNPLTDDLIFDALERFPAGAGPNVMIMTKKTQEQLRKSRTATNTIGSPAPFVDSVAGVRIVTTDGISNSESAIV